jgi:hypothetical protein
VNESSRVRAWNGAGNLIAYKIQTHTKPEEHLINGWPTWRYLLVTLGVNNIETHCFFASARDVWWRDRRFGKRLAKDAFTVIFPR